MRNILLIGFFALALTACGDKGGGDGGGGIPAPRACVPADIPNSKTVSGSFYSSSNNNCVVTECKPGFTISGYSCRENDVTPPGGGGTIGAPSISYSPNLRVSVVGTVMVALTPSVVNCEAPAICTFNLQGAVVPPAGINFNTATGTFSGLATEVSSRLLTVRVQNNATTGVNSATTTVQINIVHPVPAGLAISGTSGTNYYGVGVSQVLNISYSSAAGSVNAMTVSPALPPGLTLSQYQSGANPQWRISGTPTSYSAKQTYTLTATGPNTNGTATLNFQLGVLNPPSNYSYNGLVTSNPMSGGTGCEMDGSIPKCIFNKGQSFVATNPTVTGDNLVYSVVSGGIAPIPTNELPAGILLSAATGVFTTTESGAYESTLQCSDGGAGYCLYVLRVANELGSAQTQIKIRINGNAPPVGFSYAGNNGAGKFLFREVTNVGDNRPTWVNNVFPSCHGQAGCYTISPVLPNGLSFSELSGRITGSGDLGVLQGLVTYNIIAHDQQGNLSSQIQVEIKERIPVFEYTQNGIYTLEKGIDADSGGAGNPWIVQKSGGGGVPEGPLCGQLAIKVNSFTISPALPAGLVLNTGSYNCSGPGDGGQISGIPTGLIDNTVYTVTGCNTGGCGTATFQLEIPPKIEKIATGEKHSCAVVKDSSAQGEVSKVMCWGQNDKGQLGFASTDNCGGVNCQLKAKYVRIDGANGAILSGVEDITAGANHTCALMNATVSGVAGGRVYCWGDNSSGQLGAGVSASSSVVPVAAMRSTDNYIFKKVASLSAGGNQTCLSGEITTVYRNTNSNDPDQYDFIGQVFCSNAANKKMVQLDDPSVDLGANHYRIFAAKSLSVGDGHACAQVPQPALITDQDTGVTAISVTYSGVPVRIKCWGSNDMGQLGVASPASSSSPVTVATSLSTAELSLADFMLVAGGKHSCYIAGTTIKCWGSNQYGQLGRSTGSNLYDYQISAIPLSGNNNSNTLNRPSIRGLGATAFSSLFAQDGPPAGYSPGVNPTVSTYTSGKFALSGVPYTGTQSTVPTSILDNSYDGFYHGTGPLSIGASTQDFACASGQTTAGVRCWGKNDKGQLGINSTTDSVTPVKLRYNFN